MTIETKELVISEELKRKVEMICRFAYVEYEFINGNIKSIKNTNIAYVKPHILKVKNNDYLIFEEYDEIFINGYEKKIKFKDLEEYIKAQGVKNFPGQNRKMVTATNKYNQLLFFLFYPNDHFPTCILMQSHN